MASIRERLERVQKSLDDAREDGASPLVRATLDDGCIVEVIVERIGGEIVPVIIDDGEVGDEP
jgi:hypothetical protein